MVKNSYIFILIICCSCVANTQSIKESPAKLKSIFERYHKLNLEIPDNKIYYVDYSVNAQLRKEDNEATNQRIQSWMSKDRQVVINDHVEVYSTSSYTASIMVNEKRVNITPLPRGYAQQAKSQFAFSLIDRLFEKYNVIACTLVKGNLYKITLTPDVGGLEDFNVKKAEILVDWVQAELKGFTTIMGHLGEIESMTLTINELDFDNNGKDKLIDFTKKYISNKGKLTGKFKGFSLIDNRPKKS